MLYNLPNTAPALEMLNRKDQFDITEMVSEGMTESCDLHTLEFSVFLHSIYWSANKIHIWEVAFLTDCLEAAWRYIMIEEGIARQNGACIRTRSSLMKRRNWQWFARQNRKHIHWGDRIVVELYVKALRNAQILTFAYEMDLPRTALHIAMKFRYHAWDRYHLSSLQILIGADGPMCLICDFLLLGDPEIVNMVLNVAQDDKDTYGIAPPAKKLKK